MIDAEKIKEILDDTLENPFWAEYYNNAPSEKCKEYIALEFYYSEYEDAESDKAMNMLENELSIDDWKHLLKYAANGPQKGVIAWKIAELESAG